LPESTTTQGEQQQRLEVKLRRELGDTILTLLNDDAVEDIVLNPDGALWAKQMGSGFRRVGQMSASQAVCAMNTIASMRSMVLNYEKPVLETELPIDGNRFEGLIPPVVRYPVFAIRRRPRRIFTLDQDAIPRIWASRIPCLFDGDPVNWGAPRVRQRSVYQRHPSEGSPAWAEPQFSPISGTKFANNDRTEDRSVERGLSTAIQPPKPGVWNG